MTSVGGKMIARSFSTSGAMQQMVKPKLAVFGTSGRYANALFSAASKKKELSQVEKDLSTVSNLLETDKQFSEFMLNPLTPKAKKSEAISSILTKKKWCNTTGNFLNLLSETNKMKELPSVVSTFQSIMAAERGEIVCEVIVAKELDAAARKELDAALAMFLKSGETIQTTIKVDPSIIGGMKVSIGDRYVDMSVASKIKMYSSLISQAV